MQVLDTITETPAHYNVIRYHKVFSTFPAGKAKEANLRAVGDDEERLPVDHERLDVVWFANLQDVDVLDLDELVGGGVPFVNVRAPEQLGHDDEEVVVDHHWLADHSGGA